MTTNATQSPLWSGVKFVAGLASLLWAVEIVDSFVLGSTLQAHGLRPREVDGLGGIVTSPFLHGTFAHLASNTIPFLVLGSLVVLRGLRTFAGVSLGIVVVGGALTWIFARSANHIGASGLIFGWLAFLLLAGLFERRLASILVSVAVGLVYGGLLWGVLPGDPGVSWEGHLFGAVGGVFAARGLSRRSQVD
jgi:membrane associated rhomboid family serine protease